MKLKNHTGFCLCDTALATGIQVPPPGTAIVLSYCSLPTCYATWLLQGEIFQIFQIHRFKCIDIVNCLHLSLYAEFEHADFPRNFPLIDIVAVFYI